jgi:tRNA threonylcarbamoyladenosine biosynthesis protein TsaE
MGEIKIHVKGLADLSSAATQLLQELKDNRIFAFYGAMGVGKTTFIKEICKAMGVSSIVNSPTFAVINEYHTLNGDSLYHFDFYRINKLEEAYDFGYEDYFYSGNYCFIEWPEKIESLLPENAVKIYLSENPDQSRFIYFNTK